MHHDRVRFEPLTVPHNKEELVLGIQIYIDFLLNNTQYLGVEVKPTIFVGPNFRT